MAMGVPPQRDLQRVLETLRLHENARIRLDSAGYVRTIENKNVYPRDSDD